MTVEEAINILETYPKDQSVFIRVWLKENQDYLDWNHIDVVADKIQQSISGAALFTGTAIRSQRSQRRMRLRPSLKVPPQGHLSPTLGSGFFIFVFIFAIEGQSKKG